MKKRILSISFVIIMVLSMLPITALAAETHTVTFDANGGSGTMVSGNPTDGVDYTIPECEFTHEHYTFDGWNTKADGSGVNYAANDTERISSDITLYAQWCLDLSNKGETVNDFYTWTSQALEGSGHNIL